MQYMNLLGAWKGSNNLDDFAKEFFAVAGASEVEERESSNYVDGRYYRGKVGDIAFTVSLSDLAGNEDLPIWVQVKCDTTDVEALISAIDEMIRNRAVHVGFHFARMLNYGSQNELRIDY